MASAGGGRRPPRRAGGARGGERAGFQRAVGALARDRRRRARSSSHVPSRRGRLHTSHAFHSSMMDPILQQFERIVATVSLSEPLVPYVATQTGTWARNRVHATGLLERAAPIDGPVRGRARALTEAPAILGKEGLVLVEVGPGRTLATFADQTARTIDRPWHTVATLPTADESESGLALMLRSLGRCGDSALPVDWERFHEAERRRRVSLPTYPFERESYWIGAPVRTADTTPPEPRDVSDWFYVPEWQPADADARTAPAARGLTRGGHGRRGGARRRGRGSPPASRRPSLRRSPRCPAAGTAPSDEFVVDPDDPDSLRADGGRGVRHGTPGRSGRLLGRGRRPTRPTSTRAGTCSSSACSSSATPSVPDRRCDRSRS